MKEAPAAEAAKRPTQRQNITNRIRSPRQHRALSALLHGPQTVRSLLDIAGGNGIPQLIDDLRHKGIVIHTEQAEGLDRDGRKSRYGVYSLDMKSRPLVIELLKLEPGQG